MRPVRPLRHPLVVSQLETQDTHIAGPGVIQLRDLAEALRELAEALAAEGSEAGAEHQHDHPADLPVTGDAIRPADKLAPGERGRRFGQTGASEFWHVRRGHHDLAVALTPDALGKVR